MSLFQRFLQSIQAGTSHATHNLGLNIADAAMLDGNGEHIDLVDCLTTLGYEVQTSPIREL